MSYCKHIDIKQIDNMCEFELNHTLNNCELNCSRYSLCDTCSYMLDKIKEYNMKYGRW